LGTDPPAGTRRSADGPGLCGRHC